MFKGAKVLVAGGTGFIGTHLIKRLLAEGCLVRATVHRIEPFLHDDGIEYVQADLTSLKDCDRVTDGVDYVFMCAANTSGAGVIAKSPLVHITPNVVMNAQMLDASYRANVKKFCFVSSNCVYPPVGNRSVEEDEMMDGEPHEVYHSAGWMKRYSEILCQTYAQKIKQKMPVVVVRPTNAYGPYDDFCVETSHMMAALIRKIVERQRPIEVWGTGDEVKDLIYISDLIDGLVAAFQKNQDYMVLNIGSGQGYSVKEVVETIVRVDGYSDAQIYFDVTKPTVIPIRLVSTRRAKETLGFEAQHSLEEGIAQTVEWYRENANLWVKV